MELISSNLKIDFIAKGKYAIAFSLAMIVGTVYLWVERGEEKYGIDYKGGHEIVIGVDGDANSSTIRTALEKSGMKGATVQSFGGAGQEFVIRLGSGQDAKTVREQIDASLKGAFGDAYALKKTDFVGPTIGAELRNKALVALLIGLVGILTYVSFRFEFAFALGAVVALFHDVIVATGIYLLSGNELTMGSLAAALTIVGYSVNDTIVIFDRVREDITRSKSFNLREVLNHALNITLSRTIVTSLLTLFTAGALLVFGGGAIRDLSLYLVAGIIAGSYSTIFIAAPVTLAWYNYRMRAREEQLVKQGA